MEGRAREEDGGGGAGDDAELQRLLDGDEDAFDALVTRLHAPMLRLASTIAGAQGASEVVQETWAAVLDGLDRFEGRSSLKTWIYRILTNRAKTWATREARSLPASFQDDPEPEASVDPSRFTRRGNWATPPAPWDEKTPEALFLRMEQGALLAAEIDNLPAAQRAVVLLRDVEGSSSIEVCEILGLTEANQRVLLHRGRSKLRAAMERHLTGK